MKKILCLFGIIVISDIYIGDSNMTYSGTMCE